MKKTNQEKKIEQLTQELEECKKKHLRALADYQNLEKRMVKQLEEERRYASEGILLDLLNVLDTLQKAEEHLKDEGLALAVNNFKNILETNGIKKIEVINKQFNPYEMECVELVKSDKNDVVVEEIRPGYSLRGKVIRVAQVKVGKKQIENI